MPPCRYSDAPRRSRRLSNIPARNYDEDGFEVYEPEAYSTRYTSESNDASYSPHPPPPPSECPSPPSSHDEQYSAHHHTTRTKKGSEDHVPRPPNAFILFRSWLWECQKQNPTERDHREISRMAGVKWNRLSSEEKDYWRKRAYQVKIAHKVAHPEYRYAPNARRKPRVQKKKAPRSNQKEVRRCEQVAERLMRGESLDHGLKPVVSPAHIPSPASPAPSSLSSHVEVKVESPQPELSFNSLSPQPARTTSPSIPVVGHYLQPPVTDGPADEHLELQYPDFVKSEEEDCDTAALNLFVFTDDIPTIYLPAPVVPVLAAPTPVLKEESPYASPRVDSPVLPSDREIDNYFGCRHEIHNLDPQQMIFTNSNGYQEVSSFPNSDQESYSPHEAHQSQTTTWYEPDPSANHANVNSESTTVPVYCPQPVAVSSNAIFNDDFLYELAQNNPSYIY
ncbi:hypothetical protein V5O48_000633 [Marasmius crinis-equi]|uniref:HMG box domain-containing protein n=1 Tax=Marasmius crinis-equi TaxID=585013 RepID=A0ABR3G137_9AGAR